MTACGSPIGGGVASFLCRLDAGHDGPHSSPDIMRTVEARKRWTDGEKQAVSEDAAVSPSDDLVSRPMTFAQHYMSPEDQPPAHPSERDAEDAAVEVAPDHLPERVQERERSEQAQAIADAIGIVSAMMDCCESLVEVLRSMLGAVEKDEMRE